MRLFSAIILLALSSALGFGQVAEFSIDKSTHKFPQTKQGEVIVHDFKVTNTGKTPLIISQYEVGCSCTSVDFSNDPIAPGESSLIRVTFDSKGKYGFQDRMIKLYTNAKKEELDLRIKVKVVPNE